MGFAPGSRNCRGELAWAEVRVSRLVITGGHRGTPGAPSPIAAVTVLPWREGTEVSVLPQAYQDLVEVAAGPGRPLRAGEFAAATGQGTERRR